MQQLFVGPETARVVRAGPLGKHVDGFVEALIDAGYEPASIHEKVLVVAQLGSWLERRGLGVRDIDDKRIRRFLCWRRRRYRAHRGTQTTLIQLQDHLRKGGVLSPAVAPVKHGRTAEIEGQYATYLREERGLAQPTLVNYLPLIHRFLIDRFGRGQVRLDQLRASDVTRFVLRLMQ
jgi:site-specific recombinase XerD